MLIACSECHRQYDVGDFAPGSKVRCTCGALTVVPERAPRQVQVLHCSDCGGRLRSAAETCEYCGAEVAPAERSLGTCCPECFALVPRTARFCSHCGVALAPVAALRAVADRDCPRCGVALAVLERSAGPFHECTRCGGVWLERAVFERFIEARKAEAPEEPPAPRPVVRGRSGGHTPRSQRPTSPPIRCPACQATMAGKEFAAGSGIHLDACYPHGWWFDAGELSALAGFVRSGGLRAARARQRAAVLRRRRLARRKAERRRAATLDSPFLELLFFALGDD